MASEIRCEAAGIDCPFLIRSEREAEVIEFAREHARNLHDADPSESELREVMVER